MKRGLGEKIRALFAKGGYTCDGCGLEVFEYPEKRLCEECERALLRVEKHVCPKCGRRSIAEGVCLTCKRRMPEFTVGISPFVYEGLSASLVNRFKNGERYLRDFFAEEMVKTLRERLKESEIENMIVTFVPASEEKRQKRGYDQAEELAIVVAEQMGLELDGEILVKTRETGEQKLLTAKERAENLKGSFRVHKRTLVNGRSVLLIDDIMTTGSTGSECARVLKNAGASKVVFLTATSVPIRK